MVGLFNIVRPVSILGAIILWMISSTATYAQTVNPTLGDKLRNDTIRDVKSSLQPLISRYCYDSCELIDVKVDVEEELSDTDDLGFEGVTEKGDKLNYYVGKVVAEIQIDDRISVANRARLENIFMNYLRSYAVSTQIQWRTVTVPAIGSGAQDDRALRETLEQRIAEAMERVITMYCPEQCILAQINVEGTMVSPDEASTYPVTQTVTDKSGRNIMRVDSADVEVTMDASLDDASRERIANIMRAKLRFVTPLNLNVAVTPFPESYSKQRERLRQESEDPYGLEKLRRMLMLFRDLASTKEIISKETKDQTIDSKAESSINESTKSESKDRRTDNSASQQIGGMTDTDWVLVLVAALAALIFIAGITMRLANANKEAKVLMAGHEAAAAAARQNAQAQQTAMQGQQGVAGATTVRHQYGVDKANAEVDKEIALRLKIEKTRAEIANSFIENPKVARETFARMLKESGVEETAKYVHILGHMVVFNLLDDPNLQRDLYELSEYYHNTQFSFSIEEEGKLLETLRTRVTATEIKILSRKALDKFDFLAKLDADQIYKLISEENMKVQCIVLTQLEKKRRMAVFGMYTGQPKIDLMNELSRADAIPREYLSNVAQALNKKITTRPEFDTTNLRSSDILLDLLENASVDEQRRLMYNLQKNNPETARSIKMKLVTIEMLPFLKDGHLLELILGIQREDLLAFLMGTKDHIRDLLLSKAPAELSESWQEDLRYMASVDGENYRMVEMKILARIRNLASTGAISILDINDMIFSDQGAAAYLDVAEQTPPSNLSRGSMVA
jgi:flagellar motor switch protein FliG